MVRQTTDDDIFYIRTDGIGQVDLFLKNAMNTSFDSCAQTPFGPVCLDNSYRTSALHFLFHFLNFPLRINNGHDLYYFLVSHSPFEQIFFTWDFWTEYDRSVIGGVQVGFKRKIKMKKKIKIKKGSILSGWNVQRTRSPFFFQIRGENRFGRNIVLQNFQCKRPEQLDKICSSQKRYQGQVIRLTMAQLIGHVGGKKCKSSNRKKNPGMKSPMAMSKFYVSREFMQTRSSTGHAYVDWPIQRCRTRRRIASWRRLKRTA